SARAPVPRWWAPTTDPPPGSTPFSRTVECGSHRESRTPDTAQTEQAMKFKDLDLSGLDKALHGEEGTQKLHDPSVHVLERRQIAQRGLADFSIDSVPQIRDALKEKNSLPPHLVEDANRRAMWSFLFENSPLDTVRARYDGRNGHVRRCG